MLLGFMLALRPTGMPLTDSVIADENVPIRDVLTVADPLAPAGMVTDPGEIANAKSLVVAVTDTLTLVVAVFVPSLAVTNAVYVPAGTEVAAVIVNVDDPAPPAIVVGLSAAVMPLGSPATESDTVVTPPETVILLWPLLPAAIVNAEGDADAESAATELMP